MRPGSKEGSAAVARTPRDGEPAMGVWGEHLLAGVLVAEGVELGGAGAHDVV